MTKQLIILTGAGFTKNCGGLLADEMWAIILNNLDAQHCDRGKKLMLDNDYESSYQYIIKGQIYLESEKKAFVSAINSAYAFQEKSIVSSTVNSYKLANLGLLISTSSSLFFTLNQDLFVEKNMYRLIPDPRFFKIPEMGLDPSNTYSAPTKDKLLNKEINKEIEANPLYLNYIKLHGSINWQDKDGNTLIIGGKDKIEDIYNEPLLRLYIECFRYFLNTSGKRLLIIGYGFRDNHINKIIADGVSNGLKVYVINNQSFDKLRHSSIDIQNTQRIWKGLYGYYKVDSLNDFEKNGNTNPYFELLTNNLRA